MATLEERFWAKVDKSGDCWLWTASTMNKGYGKFRVGSAMRLAHTVAWFLVHGEFSQLCVLHRCDNPLCVRPDHLFEGTKADNAKDASAKGRIYRPTREQSHDNSFLTPTDVQIIKKLRKRGWLQQDIADRFDVHQATISKVLRSE